MRLLSAISRPSPSPASFSPPVHGVRCSHGAASCSVPPPSLPAAAANFPCVIHRPCNSHGRLLAPPPRSVFPSSPALVSSVGGLFEFICAGPLVKKMGYTEGLIEESIDRWLQAGLHLCLLFGLNELQMTIPEKARIYHFYVPVFIWCEDQIAIHRSKFGEGEDVPPLVIGVSAPQGSGKTTLVFALDHLFRRANRNSATLSIDDFYLTAEGQAKLRSENPGNALLEVP